MRAHGLCEAGPWRQHPRGYTTRVTWQLLSVIPVWVASLIAAIVIAVTTPEQDWITWLAIAFGGAVVATFTVQLAIQRSEGFVVRAMASIGGSLVVLAAATGVLVLL